MFNCKLCTTGKKLAGHTHSKLAAISNQLINIYWARSELGTAAEIEMDKDMALMALVIYLW